MANGNDETRRELYVVVRDEEDSGILNLKYDYAEVYTDKEQAETRKEELEVELNETRENSRTHVKPATLTIH